MLGRFVGGWTIMAAQLKQLRDEILAQMETVGCESRRHLWPRRGARARDDSPWMAQAAAGPVRMAGVGSSRRVGVERAAPAALIAPGRTTERALLQMPIDAIAVLAEAIRAVGRVLADALHREFSEIHSLIESGLGDLRTRLDEIYAVLTRSA